MPEPTNCYAQCQQCAWTHSNTDDTHTEHQAQNHSHQTAHTVNIHYQGHRR